MGLISGVFGLSSVIGPTLGGFVTDSLSWHWIFFINIPLGVPVILLFVKFFPNLGATGRRPNLDYLGVCTLVLGVVPLLLALSWGGVQYDWGSAQIIGLLAWAALMTALFIANEARASDPIIPLFIFRNPVVSISMLVVFLTGFGMFGGIIFVPLFFQAVLGASATSAGSFLTPMVLGVVGGAATSGQALARLGGHYRLQGLLGLTIMAIGLFLLSRMSPETSYGQAIANIVLMGIGIGITLPLYTLAVQNTVPYRVLGAATSSTQFFRSIGGTMGLAILGSVMANRFASTLQGSVPQEVREAMPEGQLEALGQNPQALINPEANAQLQEAFTSAGTEGPPLFQQLLASLQDSLSSAIGDVFLISLALVAVAWIANLFLGEVRLRSRPDPRPAPEPGPGLPQAEPAGDGG